MARRDLKSVAAALAPAAVKLPTQKTTDQRPAVQGTPDDLDPIVQFSFGLRKSLRKELQRLAADADMPMRAFILDALKEKGLSITDADLVDLRKRV